MGRLSDGAFVLREGWRTRAGAVGLVREPVAVARLSSDGARLDTVGLFPGRESFIRTEGGRGVMSRPPFARDTHTALRGDELVIGDPAAFEVELYAATGALLAVFHVPGVELGLTRGEVARFIAEEVALAPPARRAARRAELEAMDVPETRPAYGRLLVDSEGDVWVGEYVTGQGEPNSWTVFSPEGRLLGPVRVPDRFRAMEIEGDEVLGVWRDALDLEHVRSYGLVKPGHG
ncbi:MAG: hypothetical protein ACE5HP_04975 [Gemmatimonadota bacterium]